MAMLEQTVIRVRAAEAVAQTAAPRPALLEAETREGWADVAVTLGEAVLGEALRLL
jgi:hypothetical protein